MTTNWAEAEAGRALDAEVAERVAGWRWVPCAMSRPTYYLHPPASAAKYKQELVKTTESLPAKVCREYIRTMPAYSTDPAASRQVVEAMRAKGYRVTVIADSDGGNRAEFLRPYADGADANAPTLDLAICRAALAALEATR